MSDEYICFNTPSKHTSNYSLLFSLNNHFYTPHFHTQNAAFEKNNPDFCGEFRADQLKRAEAAKVKESGANVLRLKGNRFFKAKKYNEAIEKYMASLKVQPYTVNTLTNISIAYHKKFNFEDALEFASRSVYLQPTSIKARCRRATTLRVMGKLDEALEDAKYAFNACKEKSGDNSNSESKASFEAWKVRDEEMKEVSKLVEELEGEISDQIVELKVGEDAKQAAVKDDEIEKKLFKQRSAAAAPSSSGGFKKVAIDIDDDSTDDDSENQSDNTSAPVQSAKVVPRPPQPPSIESLMSSLTGGGTSGGSDPLAELELPSQYRIIDELISTLKDPTTNGVTKSGVSALNVLSLLLKDSKEARVYLRTSDGLMFLCCRLCGGGLAAPTPVSNVIAVRPDGEGFDLDDGDDDAEIGRPHAQLDPDPARTLAAIAVAVVGERRSKVLVQDQGVFRAATELLLKSSYPPQSEGGDDSQGRQARLMMDTLADECDSTLVSQLLEMGEAKSAVGVAALALMSACIDGVGGESYAHFLASDVPSLTAILSTLPTSSTAKTSDKTCQLGEIRQFALSSSLFRDLCLVETCREMIFKHTLHPVEMSTKKPAESFRFFPQTQLEIKKQEKLDEKKKRKEEVVKAPDPVSTFATSLQVTTRSGNNMSSMCKEELADARECAVAALANLALHVAMRARFTPALLPLLDVATHVQAATNKKGKKKGKNAASNMCETAAASAFSLAALMNTLISEDDMKLVLCDNQGVSKLLQLLQHICGSAYGVIRVRVAGLLGRLVSVPSTIEELRKDVSVSIMSDAINNNCTEYTNNKEKVTPQLLSSFVHSVIARSLTLYSV